MRLICVLIASAGVVLASGPAEAGDPEAGRRLYWEGVAADGVPVKATTRGDIEISGAQFSCVSCHRPSAYGSSEGGVYVPPILGDLLYEASAGDRNRIFKELFQEVQSKEFWAKMRDPRSRPAYDDKSLARAILEGVDPAGRVLDETMPRYRLGAKDAENIVAYLKSLGRGPIPGVGGDEIRFATIVGPNVSEIDADAVVSTIEAFFRWKNLHTQGDLSSPGFSPLYRSEFLDSYRNWSLDVWRLEGEPETWNEQLEKLYAAKPVFAVVGGIVAGPHAPIADFCDRSGTPCIFPSTDLPQTRDVAYRYNLYFTRGRELEGEALANYIVSRNKGSADIRQFYLEDRLGAASAVSFMGYAQMRGARVISEGFSDKQKLLEAANACCERGVDAVVIWPGASAAYLAPLLADGKFGKVSTVGLPSDAAAYLRGATGDATKRMRFAWPYERPGALHPREFDVRAWMGARKVKIVNPRLQFETYFALTMIEHSLQHMLGDFNQEYLIELIEHEAEKNLNVGTHPTLALGPGQRFASKGAYVMRLDNEADKGIAPDSDWIIP